MSEHQPETAAILQELRSLRADQAEQYRMLKNKIASLRWVVNRLYDEQERLACLLDDDQATPE